MRIFRRTVTLVLALALALSCGLPCAQAADVQVELKAEFRYEDARAMAEKINDLRTGDDAWYISSNNRTRVRLKGLKALEYDYSLEKVAMQRALEIAVLFGHTRPNGAAWSSLYPRGYNARGENIAYGYCSVSSVFKAFCEEKAKYNGQGHRRNMLNRRFTKVGIGAVKVGGVMYWVQEFGCGGAKGSSGKQFKSTVVKVSEKTLKSVARKVQTEQKEMYLQVGKSAAVPTVTIISRSGAKMILKDSVWKAGNNSVKVKKAKVTGVKTGKTKLKATAAGTSLTVPVSVITAQEAEAMKVTGDAEMSTIDEYETALGTEYIFLEEDDECFEADGAFEADDVTETEEPIEEDGSEPAEE